MVITKKVFQPEPIVTVVMEMTVEDLEALHAALSEVSIKSLPSFLHMSIYTIRGEVENFLDEIDPAGDYIPGLEEE